ncbi:MAG TPA: fatty acid--CoA ligase family protein [bacterium]|nr:fatty acid--CoA ligase family protein [bacterium]
MKDGQEKLFFYDPLPAKAVSYNQLLNDLNRLSVYHPCRLPEDSYTIFLDLLSALIHERELVLLDKDLSGYEIEKLDIPKSFFEAQKLDAVPLTTWSDILEKIKNAHRAKIVLFTSGTTGIPKKITHTIQSLTRSVKISIERQDDIWGLAYNPTHIAGLQVFFQALLNLNSLVNLFELPKDHIHRLIDSYRITNISATPTFFRLLFPAIRSFPTVKRITSGGERFDPLLKSQLQNMFPNAKFRNIYASTEAGTVLAAEGEIFSIKPSHAELAKIVDQELLVHETLLGVSNRFVLDDGWYHTGDRVEIISSEPLTFRFLHRDNEMINVAGYNVNPYEVESVINSHPFVRESRVYGKPNKLIGNVLHCDLVSLDASLDELQIRRFLQDKLQPYKIPRIINFVDTLDKTRTGKLKRS